MCLGIPGCIVEIDRRTAEIGDRRCGWRETDR